MALSAGTQLGSCEIMGLLGAGSMGEVYRGRDTKLGREVAVKALPDAFAHDAERLARFEREAQVLVALNHPNLAVIHEMKEITGSRDLILELVEGETLAERIAGGPLPLDEALALCSNGVCARMNGGVGETSQTYASKLRKPEPSARRTPALGGYGRCANRNRRCAQRTGSHRELIFGMAALVFLLITGGVAFRLFSAADPDAPATELDQTRRETSHSYPSFSRTAGISCFWRRAATRKTEWRPG